MSQNVPAGGRHRRIAATMLVAVAALGMALPASAPALDRGEVKVMTRNLYLGADLTPALEATSLPELASAASQIYSTVIETNFRQRAKLLAAEIADNRPDLVGLQEVALWRIDQPADGPATPALDVTYNFLRALNKNLNRLDAPYRVVQKQREADIEVPTSSGFDGRLTMRDAILAHRDTKTRLDDRDNFDTNLELTNVGGSGLNITVHRGWTSTEARVRGVEFRFINTHLEAFHPIVRESQAEELVAPRGPASRSRPVVLLGDLNTDDDLVALGEGTAFDELAYAVFTGAGFVERSPDLPGTANDRFSCCYHTETIMDPNDTFDHNVDHVMVNKDEIELLRAKVTGNTVMTPSGLWPSDHGGVISVLRFP